MDYFTADTHFGHANMIGFANRPYQSEREMNTDMIRRWNQVIGPHDVVYHLGDFTLGGESDAAYFFSKLNGRIKILGCHWHHDRRWLPAGFGPSCFISKSNVPVEIMPPMVVLEYRQYSDDDFPKAVVLSHYPMGEWDRKHYGAYHLFGHSHGNYRPPTPFDLYMDVGVDCQGYAPISIAEIDRIMRNRQQRQAKIEGNRVRGGNPTWEIDWSKAKVGGQDG